MIFDVLNASSREIRRLNRSRVPVLWGATRTRHRQYGSAEDRRLYTLESADWQRLARIGRAMGEALTRSMRDASQTANSLGAALLATVGRRADGAPS